MVDLPVEVHEAANLFPMLDGEKFEELKADIEKNGVQVWMTFYDGKLLDGRNRYRACLELGINPEHYADELDTESVPDPIAWVLSTNLHRRHLTTSQRAMIAAKVLDLYAEQAKERQVRKPESVVENLPPQEKGKARDKAGEAVGVSGKTVDQARKVQTKGTEELQQAVNSGKVAVSRAAKIADLPPEEQPKAVEEAVLPRQKRPESPKPATQNHSTAVEKIRRLLPEAEDKLVVAKDLFDNMDEWQRERLPMLWNGWITGDFSGEPQ